MNRIIFLLCSQFLFFSLSGQTATFAQSVNEAIKKAKTNYTEGNYSQSLSGVLPLYERARLHHDQELFADAGNLIGLIHLAQGNAADAMKYFQNAASVNKHIKLQNRLAANYLNISLAFSDLQMIDSALLYCRKTFEVSRAAGSHDLELMAHNHMGEYYFRQKKLAAAEKEYEIVLKSIKYSNDWEYSFAYTGLARIRYEQKNFQESAALADKGFIYAQKAGAKWDAVQALELAHQAYWHSGNAQEAYNRLKNLKLYSDSLSSNAKDKEINGLLLKEKSSENKSLVRQVRITAQQAKIDQLIIIIVTLIGIIFIIIAIIIYRRSVKVARKSIKLEEATSIALNQSKLFEAENAGLNELNHQKDQLLSIIGHDLRSPFAMLQGTLSLFHTGDLTEEEVISIIAELDVQVNSATTMLDSLLVWAGKQLRGMSFQPVLIDLVTKVDKVISVLAVLAKRKNVTIVHQKTKLPQVVADADQVRIIIQNLVSNAIKFTSANGTVEIWYDIKPGYVELQIQDTGIGMTPEALEEILSATGNHRSTYGTQKEKGIGLGINLVKEFAFQNKIIITATSKEAYGTTFTLSFSLLPR